MTGKCRTGKMKKIILSMLLGGSLLIPAAVSADEMKVSTQHAQERREILQKYREDDAVHQMLVVSHTTGWEAKIWFYEKQEYHDAWTLTFESTAFVGLNEMGKTVAGDGKTPLGDYEITGAFGILENPGTALSYIDVTPTTYACGDDCEYYNTIIDTEETGHDCSGEEMYKYSPEYNYGLTTGYNSENVYPLGSAIFVHCKGLKPFTGGCIALDESDMKTVLMAAEDGMRIYLDEYYE